MAKIASSKLYKGRIQALQGPEVNVGFFIEGAEFEDQTTASYDTRGGSNEMTKQAADYISRKTGVSELSTKFQGAPPKQLAFNIKWVASGNVKHVYSSGITIAQILDNIKALQSLCYPRMKFGGNPPMVRLSIAKLYDLRVLVTQASVTWFNYWKNGYPMGCTMAMGFQGKDYLTAAAVRQGAGFNSTELPYNGEVKE